MPRIHLQCIFIVLWHSVTLCGGSMACPDNVLHHIHVIYSIPQDSPRHLSHAFSVVWNSWWGSQVHFSWDFSDSFISDTHTKSQILFHLFLVSSVSHTWKCLFKPVFVINGTYRAISGLLAQWCFHNYLKPSYQSSVQNPKMHVLIYIVLNVRDRSTKATLFISCLNSSTVGGK